MRIVELAGAALLDVGLHPLEAGVHRVVGGERRVDVEHGLRRDGQRGAPSSARQRAASTSTATSWDSSWPVRIRRVRGAADRRRPARCENTRGWSSRSCRSTRTRRAGARHRGHGAVGVAGEHVIDDLLVLGDGSSRATRGSSSDRKRTRSSCALASSTARQTRGRPAIATSLLVHAVVERRRSAAWSPRAATRACSFSCARSAFASRRRTTRRAASATVRHSIASRRNWTSATASTSIGAHGRPDLRAARSSRPSLSRRMIASRTGVRLTPSCCAISFSDSVCPGRIRPERISSRSQAYAAPAAPRRRPAAVRPGRRGALGRRAWDQDGRTHCYTSIQATNARQAVNWSDQLDHSPRGD